MIFAAPDYASLHPGYGFNFQTAEPSLRAKRSNPSFVKQQRKESWMASSQGLLAMTARNEFALAARSARGLLSNFLAPQSEGAGNAWRRCAAAKSVHVVATVTPETPGIPRAMVYGLLRALPGDRALLPPSPLRSLLLKSLTPASGRQDHTTSPSAASTSSARRRVHRIPPRRP
jgi:hypothetical protein